MPGKFLVLYSLYLRRIGTQDLWHHARKFRSIHIKIGGLYPLLSRHRRRCPIKLRDFLGRNIARSQIRVPSIPLITRIYIATSRWRCYSIEICQLFGRYLSNTRINTLIAPRDLRGSPIEIGVYLRRYRFFIGRYWAVVLRLSLIVLCTVILLRYARIRIN